MSPDRRLLRVRRDGRFVGLNQIRIESNNVFNRLKADAVLEAYKFETLPPHYPEEGHMTEPSSITAETQRDLRTRSVEQGKDR